MLWPEPVTLYAYGNHMRYQQLCHSHTSHHVHPCCCSLFTSLSLKILVFYSNLSMSTEAVIYEVKFHIKLEFLLTKLEMKADLFGFFDKTLFGEMGVFSFGDISYDTTDLCKGSIQEQNLEIKK